MKKINLFLGLLLAISAVLAQSPNYIFESGFEGGSQLFQYQLNGSLNPDYADIEGNDNGYDWVNDLDNDTTLGSFRIYYQEGDTLKAKAEIVSDPLDPGNKVLEFHIEEPHISYVGGNGNSLEKGRIQAGINGNVNLTEFNYQAKLYLHPDLDSLRSSPMAISWFTLQELWNNEAQQAYPFRVTLNLQKPAGIGSQLFFGAHGQTRIAQGNWDSKWEVLDTSYVVPLGEWLTVDTYFREGDSLNGQFKVSITDAQGNQHEIVNIHHFTHHPSDPNPDGVTSFHPMKLYTSGELIDGMNAVGARLSIYWDDFKIGTDSSLVTRLEKKITEQPFFYPNPVRGILKTASEIEISELSVLNTSGALMETITSPSKEINFSKYRSGIYFLQWKSASGQTGSLKILKL